MQRRQKARLLPRKVKVQPAPGLGKDKRFPFGMLGGQSVGKIFCAVEPQPGQPDLVRRQQDTAQRGVIMLNICHRICTSPAEKQAVTARSLFIIIPHSAAKLYPYFAKYPRCFLSDRLKIAFSPYCVCRGDHWSPASLPPQRIFRDSFLARQTGTGEQCSPLQKFFSTVCKTVAFFPPIPYNHG